MIPDPPELLHQFLERSAAANAAKVAVVVGEENITYGELNQASDRLAGWLVRQGLEAGRPVALLLENGFTFAKAYYGVLKAGGVVTPLSTDIKPEALVEALNELESPILISSKRFELMLWRADFENCSTDTLVMDGSRKDWSEKPGVQAVSWSEVQGGEGAPAGLPELGSGNLANIIFTSGSSGKSKGVMLTHDNMVHNTLSICEYLSLDSQDVQMVVLPFFYVMGLSLMNTMIAAGGKLVVNNQFAYPAAVVAQMESEKVTGFSGVPSTYAHLLHRSPLATYRDRLPHLRFCSQAGGAMSTHLKQELRAALPEYTRIFIMYGATEASARLSYLHPDRFRDKMESIGKAIPGVELRILDTEGREVPPGKTGEIVARGRNVMKGYWKDPEGTAKVLSEHGYHTGDLGYRDEEGFIYVRGRKDNLIKSGGHRINPLEIENILVSSGAFVEATVICVPDEYLENRIVGLGVLKEESKTPKELLAFCAKKLPSYKVPSELHFTRAIPKNANGKVDKFKCLELYQSLTGG